MTKKLTPRVLGWSLLFWLKLAGALFAQPRDIRFTHLFRNADSLAVPGRGANRIFEDSRGEFWIATTRGLLRYDREHENLRVYQHDPQAPASINGANITAICEDTSGTLWSGTFGGGLNRYDRQQDEFVRYQSVASVTAILHDRRGNLWLGTDGAGLCRLDRTTKTFMYYRHDPQNPWSLSDNNVWAIGAGHNGDLWIGTFGGGIDHFDKKNANFCTFFTRSASARIAHAGRRS